ARCEWLCKLVHGSSGRGKRRSVVGSLLSLGARVGLGSHLSHRHWLRQPNLNGARVDVECPAGAYRVPVQLVVIVEESELPGSTIANGEGVNGRNRQDVIVSGVDSDAVPKPFGKPGLGNSIALDVDAAKVHPDAIAEPVTIARGEITVDSPANRPPFSTNRDELGDIDASVRTYLHFGVVGEDSFLGDRRVSEGE